jgi:hypothetical protein
MPPQQARFGAYGLSVPALSGAEAWMQPQAAGAPILDLRVRVGAANDLPSRVDGESADLRLLGGGRLLARRGTGTVDYVLPAIPPPADLLHPYLAPAAALWWRWAGREAIHGGAFAGKAGAVLVLGPKEGGKSTTLAWLAERAGVTVLADDLAVVDRRHVLAGPRSIDLRPGEPPHPGDGTVRQGSRVRVQLAAAPDRMPLAGVVLLGWGRDVGVTDIAVERRWEVLGPQRMYPGLDADPVSLLDLAAVPMRRVTRPRRLASVEAAGRAILRSFG